ncbi:MAG: S-adenosylmethionine:tRNA ribosyltransferase-isomerase [Bacteroidia bacterium]
MSIPALSINDFDYNLPDERIAKYPLKQRNRSKLLVYENGQIRDAIFSNLESFLPPNACLVMNNTKVVAARLKFSKATGSQIEVFCLEPFETEINVAMQETKSAIWKCMVGNLKRFKDHDTLEYATTKGILKAKIYKRLNDSVLVQFDWDSGEAFAHILNAAGEVPLPPYLNRKSTEDDKKRYQTVYAQNNGAVAAPTAGLHFTDEQLQKLSNAGVEQNYVTLHVSAGTFQPVKAETLDKHNMHHEHIVVSISFLKWLLKKDKIIAVGTTSLRTLESLYWLALKSKKQGRLANQLFTSDSYELEAKISKQEAISILIDRLEQEGQKELKATTALFTMPGYSFKMIDGLITNFHQPKSTLLALIAAIVGNEWKTIYSHAINNDYRFLSYGDSSILMR